MINQRKNILIIGGSRGIGFGILSSFLMNRDDYNIFFTATTSEGISTTLSQENVNNECTGLKLNLLYQESITSLINQLKTNTITFNQVIFNSGVYYREEFDDKLNNTMLINYINTKYLCEELIKENIINKEKTLIMFVSSSLGKIKRIKDKNNEYYDILKDYENNNDIITRDLLQKIEKSYVADYSTADSHKWPNSEYAISKMLLTLYSVVLKNEGFMSYSCCPGFCKTDLTKGTNAEKSPLLAGEEIYNILNNNSNEYLIANNGKFFYNGLLNTFIE